jgi:rhomboid protease GluP
LTFNILFLNEFIIDNIPTDDWAIVFESDSRQACSDRSLVLHSLSIPYEILTDGERSFVVVPNEHFEKARYELWQYEQENKQAIVPGPRFTPVIQNGLPGVLAYLFLITIVALLAGESAFDRNWLSAGRVDGTLIRDGEWWRSITALTLHSGLPHFAGNAGFGALFGVMAGRVLGSGVTWFAVVVSSGLANLINTLLLDSSHRAIGASTAVFAALGLLAGFVWRGKLMKQDRWPYRIGPIVGGLALLAYTGTGNENTDVGAHLMGFICGFLAGIVLTYLYHYVPKTRVQRTAGILAIAIVAFSWFLALRLWA